MTAEPAPGDASPPGTESLRVASFDVFDTLITRAWAEPADLFLALGQQAIAKFGGAIDAATFARERVAAERAARGHAPAAEPTLEEIYAALQSRLAWAPSQTGAVQQLELASEAEALRGIPEMRTRLAEARRRGCRIVFLSDMYLPARFLEGVLAREGFWQAGDRLFVSNVHRASKASGELYRIARRSFDRPVAAWTHCGDHRVSDVQVPRSAGLAAEEFAGARLTRYERLARGDGAEVPTWRSQLAGAMRRARLDNPEGDPHRRVLWDSGCDVVGPLLTGFVHWCLVEARARGLARLYFISRDGQILHRLAQILCRRWDYLIDCRYLYGSRQAWQGASMDRPRREDLAWLLNPAVEFTWAHAVQRLALPDSAMRGALGSGGAAPEAALTWAERQRLHDACLQGPLTELLVQRAGEQRESVVRYLEQEGWLEGQPFAMVDIGWHGNLQKHLARLLHLAGHVPAARLTGFYFGLLQAPADPQQTLCGYWNSVADPDLALARQNLAVLEAFMMADHGGVLGYAPRGERVEPVLQQAVNQTALDHGLATVHQAVLRFAESWADALAPHPVPSAEYLAVTRRIYDCFYRAPTRSEAQAWAGFQFTDLPVETELQTLAPAWTRAQILAALLQRRRRPRHWWPEATLAMQPSLALRLFIHLRNLRHKWAANYD